jgi:hypothetical protein
MMVNTTTWVDEAAMKIAQAMVTNEESHRSSKYEIARWSYDIAYALLDEKTKRESDELMSAL